LALPLITDAFRLAHLYHSADATFVNVYWLLSPDADTEEDVALAFFDAYQNAGPSSFTLNKMHSEDILFDGAQVTKLDGTSPTVVVPYPSMTQGGTTSTMTSAQACLVITWTTGERGRDRRGRSFLGGIPAASLETGRGRWNSALVTDAEDALIGWFDGLAGGSPSITQLVVSQHGPDPGSFRTCNSGIPRQGIGTQRRRTERNKP